MKKLFLNLTPRSPLLIGEGMPPIMLFYLLKYYFFVFTVSILFISGCGNKTKETEAPPVPKANVVVTSVEKGGINDTVFLNATTIYNKKTTIQSPISGYVTKVNITIGSNVGRGSEVF